MRYIFTAVAAGVLLVGSATAQPSLTAGGRIYEICAGCHGFLAEGNALVSAPALAGLDAAYLTRQMRNFLGGMRGDQAADANGQRMAKMAETVRSDRDLDDVVAYIKSLPGGSVALTDNGDAERGRQAYAACGACHGADGRGNLALSAPALIGLDAWYITEQLRLFAEGLRGTNAGDIYGQQMRALAVSFADADARQDLARYIQSLGD
jgi:cytochrome c oxidase subunit 2